MSMSSKPARLRTLLGTNEVAGGNLMDNETQKALQLFQKSGFCDIDTANAYQDGKTEVMLGKIIEPEISISTKANPWNGNRLNSQSLRLQLETSLQRLGRSFVDVFYLHYPDAETPIEETLECVNQLHNEGKFKEFGISNYGAWQVAPICEICVHRGWIKPTVYQGRYCALKRQAENDLQPCLRYYNIRFYAYSPLASGILTGKHKYSDIDLVKDGRFWSAKWKESYKRNFWKLSHFQAINKLVDVIRDVDEMSLTEASLRWLYHHSLLDENYGDGVVLGFSKICHLESNLEFIMKGELNSAIVNAFDQMWRDLSNNS